MGSAGSRRWGIAFVLGLGVLVNYFDRVNLSVAHNALRDSFGMSDITFGYLLSAYSWTYAAMQLPSGTLLDRFGVRRVMLVGILLWSLASGLAAVATSVVVLFAARLLLGVGEAPTFPANAKAVGLWFPEEERGKPTAIFDAAAKLSIGLGTPVLGVVLLRFGLRANFATTAILSLLYAGLFLWLYRDPRSHESQMSAGPDLLSQHGMLRRLLRERKVWGLALGSGAYNYCFYLLLTWLPVYLENGVKMSAHRAVLLSGIPWMIAAAADFAIGGFLVDALIRKGRNADTVRRWVLVGGTAFGLFVFAPAFLSKPIPVVLCLSLALSGLAAAAPVVWVMPSLLAPPGGTGRIGSIMNLANQIAAITAPIATGYIRSSTHSFSAAFVAAGVILVLGIVSYLFLLGRVERVQLAAAA